MNNLSRDNQNVEIQDDNDEEETSELIKRKLDGSLGATPIGAACSSSEHEECPRPLETGETGID